MENKNEKSEWTWEGKIRAIIRDEMAGGVDKVSTDDSRIEKELNIDRPNQPGANINRGLQASPESFAIEFLQDGIDLSQWATLDSIISEDRNSGIAYKDGKLYTAAHDNSTQSSIYELNLDGSATGQTFTTTEDSHINCLQWHNGYIWAVGFNTGTILKIDFENATVADSFDYGAGTVMSVAPNNIVFVPRENGDYRMVAVSEFDESAAHVVDFEQALVDGTAAGNIDATIDAGVFTRTDGAHYRNGFVYYPVNPGNDTPAAIAKMQLPFADQIGGGYRIASDNVEWYYVPESWPAISEGHIQDLTYNPVSGEWFVVSDDNQLTVYNGTERTHSAVPKGWSRWSAVDDESYGRVIRVDSGDTNEFVDVFGAPQSNVLVTVPFYDDGETSSGNGKQVYIGVSDGTNDQNQLAVNTSQTNGDTNYYFWDGAWQDTGVSRVSGGWVLFGFYATGSIMRTLISKNGGLTWEAAVKSATGSNSITDISLNRFVTGQAKVAPPQIDIAP